MLKKSKLIVALCCLLSNGLLAQVGVIDSLHRLLENAQPGYDQIDCYFGLARAYMLVPNQDSMELMIESGQKVARAHDDLAGLSQFLIMESIVAKNFEGEVNRAFELIEKALDLARQSADPDALCLALYQLAEFNIFHKSDHESAILILTEVVGKFDKRVTIKNRANTHKAFATALRDRGDFEGALKHFSMAMDYLSQMQNEPDHHHRLNRVSATYANGGVGNMAQTLVYLAETHLDMSDMLEAEERLLQARDISYRSKMMDTYAWVNNKLGLYYIQTGKYRLAVTYLQEAQLIFEQLDLPVDVANTQIDLGDVFLQLRDYPVALEYYRKAIRLATVTQDSFLLVELRCREISTLLESSQLDQALLSLKNVEQIADGMKEEDVSMWVKEQKAKYYFFADRPREAKELMREVLGFHRMSKNILVEASSLAHLSKIYQTLGQTDSAIIESEKALSLAVKMNHTSLVVKNHLLLSELYEEVENLPIAINHLKTLHRINAELEVENAQSILRQEQVRQNVNEFKAAKDLATQEASMLTFRNKLYIGLAAGLLLILLVGGYLYLQLQKAKHALQLKNEQLDKLNQTKDRFFGIIAHDIRSPIVALEGVGEQMEFYLEKNKREKLTQLSSKITDTAKGLTALLDNLLNWALLQQGVMPHHPSQISLDDVVQETLAMYEVKATMKDISIVNRISSDVLVNADKVAVSTILRNLLGNALKFTETGGAIELDAQEYSGHIKVHIRDTGVGMDKERLSKIFELDNRSTVGTAGEKGTGLGLILCRELVELNKGEISASSHEQKGSSFEFSLPLAA